VSVARGVSDAVRGWGWLAARPRLWPLALAPAAVTLVLLIALAWGALALSDPAVAWVVGRMPGWLAGWFGGVLRLVILGLLAIGGFLAFVTIAGAIAGPFCELVSEAVETEVTGRPSPGFSLGALVRGLALGVAHAARRLAIYLFAVVLLFLLGALVPVVGTALAAAIAWYVAARSAAYDCYDAVFGRRLWRYDAKRAWLSEHRARSVGLGGTTAAAMLVPGVNLVALAAGAVGATLALLELERGSAQ
jgi:CysZ protein